MPSKSQEPWAWGEIGVDPDFDGDPDEYAAQLAERALRCGAVDTDQELWRAEPCDGAGSWFYKPVDEPEVRKTKPTANPFLSVWQCPKATGSIFAGASFRVPRAKSWDLQQQVFVAERAVLAPTRTGNKEMFLVFNHPIYGEGFAPLSMVEFARE